MKASKAERRIFRRSAGATKAAKATPCCSGMSAPRDDLIPPRFTQAFNPSVARNGFYRSGCGENPCRFQHERVFGPDCRVGAALRAEIRCGTRLAVLHPPVAGWLPQRELSRRSCARDWDGGPMDRLL